ncbi:MAG: bifunctional GTP diphosphokinase/guanosine-3',5'-bis pyrophosphate 3'-pyrophosphohydrolase [Gammaproteobacteria bacterium]|nr:bifunctional GTP diphosphokinase/guanosine-3',5'-bis pyrophosphate 3'-pyrophosphohydrolase [Gammaproteobacteria bacterium]
MNVKTLPVQDEIFRISHLSDLLEEYLEPDQVQDVYKAYLFGAEAHDGQHRVSGEPYITHPLAVAKILADMRMDYQGIIAAILHDVIEDTPTAKEQIEKEFSKEVAELVDGVSKITLMDFGSKAEAQAENFRKMMLAMVKDIRVIMIKLADRLHNMRTLGVMRPEKRRRIARETLEIYAPIANRLGMNKVRLELEDLGLQAHYPQRYRVLKEAVIKSRGNRKEILNTIETSIKRRLRQEELKGDVAGREKHLYSIYTKMVSKRLSFREVFDMYAFRVVVNSVDECYRVLGVMHSLYKPVPGKFKDYIAIPKANGYQSLHTVLFGPYGVPIEIQIRSRDMDGVAESGVAAHWLYKSGDNNSSTSLRAREWLRTLLELQKNAGDSLEFIENVKIDLFPDEVYVFTPLGEIMEMPRGATVVDFAYAVHSDVGNTCVAARVDRRLMPLRSQLYNGQTVEIITANGAHPNPSWLNFIVTAKARTNVRYYLKHLRRDEAVELGKRMLDKSLRGLDSTLSDVDDDQMSELLEVNHLADVDALFEDIGMGGRLSLLVARQLLDSYDETVGDKAKSHSLVIKGTEGMVVSFAKCCHPIPGDPVVGFVSTGRGIVVHTQGCNNIADYRKLADKWIDVEWSHEVEGDFVAEMRVDVANQRGVLATLAAIISDMDSNIENVDIEERDGMTHSINFTLTVKNRDHLAGIIRRARSVKSVMRISRKKN